ncbi:hypothetical protein GCM10010446_56060 [Streptomyces enissocaesilis]|uniref:Uncharacterized protein n=1 Tax=Streptomyces enissocaesilis TaxID=332589 RepID=A0ABN3XKA7_9ACTN
MAWQPDGRSDGAGLAVELPAAPACLLVRLTVRERAPYAE